MMPLVEIFKRQNGYDPYDVDALRRHIDNIVKQAKDEKARIERYSRWAAECSVAGPKGDGWIPMPGREGFEVKKVIHVKDGGYQLLYRIAGQRSRNTHTLQRLTIDTTT